MQNEAVSEVNRVSSLQEGVMYYAINAFETLPQSKFLKFCNMEEFYENLSLELGSSDPSKKERQIAQVKSVFDEQDLGYNQLIAVGELAITDADLEKYGIQKGGLRQAILSVIKRNQ